MYIEFVHQQLENHDSASMFIGILENVFEFDDKKKRERQVNAIVYFYMFKNILKKLETDRMESSVYKLFKIAKQQCLSAHDFGLKNGH